MHQSAPHTLYVGSVPRLGVCFFGTASLNGFSQSETNQLDGLKNMFPSVFLIKHWMVSLTMIVECTTGLKDLHYWTKITVVTG